MQCNNDDVQVEEDLVQDGQNPFLHFGGNYCSNRYDQYRGKLKQEITRKFQDHSKNGPDVPMHAEYKQIEMHQVHETNYGKEHHYNETEPILRI
jgi:hypothetical protein